jgi:hypothetical protein
MCLPRVPLDLDESLLVARVALEPAVALKNLLHEFKKSSSLVDRWSRMITRRPRLLPSTPLPANGDPYRSSVTGT